MINDIGEDQGTVGMLRKKFNIGHQRKFPEDTVLKMQESELVSVIEEIYWYSFVLPP